MHELTLDAAAARVVLVASGTLHLLHYAPLLLSVDGSNATLVTESRGHTGWVSLKRSFRDTEINKGIHFVSD